MKNLREQLVQYLEKNGKTEDYTYRELYELFPFDGNNLTNKQKGDRVRSVWKRLKKNNHVFKFACDIPVYNGERIINIKQPKILIYDQKEQPSTKGNYLVLGCVHAPFVNKPFWNSLCKFAKKNKNQIKGLILNGDFLDLNALSSHDRGRMPLKDYDLGTEYKESKKLLKQLTDSLNNDIYKAFLYGNHEDRFLRYMSYPDAQKLKGAVPSPEEGLKLDNTWNIFKDWKHDEIQLGNLTIIHGEFFNIHLCKKYLDVFKKNMMFAHSHRQQLYREGEHAAYNIGCMLDVNSPVFSYASKAMKKSWANGFALCNLTNSKTSVELITWNKDHFSHGFTKY